MASTVRAGKARSISARRGARAPAGIAGKSSSFCDVVALEERSSIPENRADATRGSDTGATAKGSDRCGQREEK